MHKQVLDLKTKTTWSCFGPRCQKSSDKVMVQFSGLISIPQLLENYIWNVTGLKPGVCLYFTRSIGIIVSLGKKIKVTLSNFLSFFWQAEGNVVTSLMFRSNRCLTTVLTDNCSLYSWIKPLQVQLEIRAITIVYYKANDASSQSKKLYWLMC